MIDQAAAGSWRRGAAILAGGLLALALCYGPALVAHVRLAAVEGWVNDDSRVWVVPYLRQYDPTLLRNDLLQDYARACVGIGYRSLFELGARLADPFLVGAFVTYSLYLVSLLAMGLAASRFGGVVAALAAVALCLGTSLFLGRLAGATPRAFAFPIVACGAAALAYGRLRALAAVVVVGAPFYAPAAFPLGVTLAVVALGLGPHWRGDLAAWSLRRRVALVALTGAVAAALVAPTALATRPYGPYITPSDLAAYPEAGPGGRFISGDGAPYLGLMAALRIEVLRGVGAARSADWTPAATLLTLTIVLAMAVVLALGRRDPAVGRLAAFAAVVLVGYHAAAYWAPWIYLPERYVRYPVPVLGVLLLVAAPSLLARRAGRPVAAAWLGGAVLALWLLLGPRGSAGVGLNVPPQRDGFEDYLAGLPPDAVIAGWPSDLNNVPLRAHRSVLLTAEHHLPFQTLYADEMRRRFAALLDAYLATEVGPLERLRARYGVTHLVFDLRHFADAPPRYFDPFDAVVAARLDATPREAFLLPTLRDRAAFTSGPMVVIDLRAGGAGRSSPVSVESAAPSHPRIP
jgi:hypothetical protein